jgi:hypothetical protein
MKNLMKILIAYCLFAYGTELLGQQTVPASGGDASGSGGSISFTIGQLIYTTDIASIGSISKGVQQPFDFITLGTDDFDGINLQCIVYPNPTSDFIKLKMDNYDSDKLVFELYDLTGKLLQTQKITEKETLISMRDFLPSFYFLKVTENNNVLKTFKIIKNQ